MSVRKSAAAVLSVILAAAMLLGCVSTAFAAGDGSISVEMSFYDGGFVIPGETVEVKDGMAEEYGYTVSEKDHNGKTVDYITVLDAIVALHKAYYGDEFTAESCKSYLNFSGGMITKMFAKSATSSGFTVNDVVPNDGIYNENYRSYTGYAADTAPVANGDTVRIFTYKDSYWSDYYTRFDSAEKTVTAGEAVSFTVTGYSIAWYGFSDSATIERSSLPMGGVDLYMIAYADGKRADKKVATLDWKGSASYTVTEPGVYYFYTSGTYIDEEEEEETPVIGNICTVTVKDLPADYSKVDAALAAVPADLGGYTDESVAALNAAIAAVDRSLGKQEQAKVDAYADAINAAVAALEAKPEEPVGKSCYLISDIKLSLTADADAGKLVLNIDFTLHDICGNAPDKAENINLVLSVTWISSIIRFIQSVIGG